MQLLSSTFCARHGDSTGKVDENARKLIKDFDVRTPSPYVPVSKLSGGNQQKVIVARELSRDVKLVIASQPTRGLDVGSIEYIHKEIVIMRDRGVGVLLISAELDEIMSLSDRIAVMYRGQNRRYRGCQASRSRTIRVVDGGGACRSCVKACVFHRRGAGRTGSIILRPW